jgi:hypothetical protein
MKSGEEESWILFHSIRATALMVRNGEVLGFSFCPAILFYELLLAVFSLPAIVAGTNEEQPDE